MSYKSFDIDESGQVLTEGCVGWIRTNQILSGVLLRGLRLSCAGLLIGPLVTVAMNRVLTSFLSEIHGLETVPLILSAGVLLVVSFAACYLSARRGAALGPLVALRFD